MSLGAIFSDYLSVGQKRYFKSRMTDNPDVRSPWSVYLVLLVVVGLWLVLVGRLVQLQVFQGTYFQSLASGNRLRTRLVHGPRGEIFDRKGQQLAGTGGVFRYRRCEPDDQCTIKILTKEEAIKKESLGLSSEESLELDGQRVYPGGESFGPVLGYVSEITAEELLSRPSSNLGDRVGRDGLERQYETVLTGLAGKDIVEVDALGKAQRLVGQVLPQKGQDLKLSLDADLQQVAYKALAGRRGAVVASDPSTGEILALVSSPAVDPNIFTSLLGEKGDRDQKITAIFADPDQPLFNRAISATYPPGSTFKMVTALAGLEAGKITAETVIDDTGILIIGPYRFPNWRYLRDGGLQGPLDVVGALKVSNDIFFYRAGEWMGLDNLEVWAKNLGLGATLGIDLPGEAPGLFPGRNWQKAVGRPWYLGDTYHLAIGQGDLLVTPLQVNAWTNVIANGGRLCRPTLHHESGIRNYGERCRDLGISAKTLELVRKGMVEACSPGGTAWPLFEFRIRSQELGEQKIQLACKTGTAEFGPSTDSGQAIRTHAWLTGYAPADKPEISVTVIVEGSGEGSDIAAPVVKRVLEEWFKKE